LIDFYPVAAGILASQQILSPSKTLVGGFAVPFGRLPEIRGDTRATGIKQAQLQLGFGIPFSALALIRSNAVRSDWSLAPEAEV